MAAHKDYKEALEHIRLALWKEEADMAKDFANAADQEAWLKHFQDCLIKQGPPPKAQDAGKVPCLTPADRKSCGVEVNDTGSRVVRICEYEKVIETDKEVDVEFWTTRPTALLVEIPGTELSRVHIGIKGPGKVHAEKALGVVETTTTTTHSGKRLSVRCCSTGCLD